MNIQNAQPIAPYLFGLFENDIGKLSPACFFQIFWLQLDLYTESASADNHLLQFLCTFINSCHILLLPYILRGYSL